MLDALHEVAAGAELAVVAAAAAVAALDVGHVGHVGHVARSTTHSGEGWRR